MESRRSLFSAFGVELEYMVVDAESLDVLPAADTILCGSDGTVTGEVERGAVDWSNELVAHVVELKVAQPVSSLVGLEQTFQTEVREVNRRLARHGARLMPTAMHPWMDPLEETVLWPHEYNAVYSAFDRIFGCQGHGWSNLQSVHLNLPFGTDEEFGRLHAAIRLVLPLLPALTASSPMVEGRLTGLMDNRLEYYRTNSRAVPLVAGRVIPEPVFTPADYRDQILGRLYAAIEEHDPDQILRHEWLNARGAIARFERGAIEIRVMDVQECPAADVAICAAVVAVLRELVEECHVSWSAQQAFEVEPLASVFLESLRNAERTLVWNDDYLKVFGVDREECTLQDLWRILLDRAAAGGRIDSTHLETLQVIVNEGPLSRRIARGLFEKAEPSADSVEELYGFLCQCLEEGTLFQVEV
jgi:carboxylate-amine ligase